jgi:hypothetical protein
MNKRVILSLLLLILAACTPMESNTTPTPTNTNPAAIPRWWQPRTGATWQIQFTGEIDTSLGVEIYDLDLFDTSKETVAQLHSDGKRAICYLNAGAWEDWRPDAANFPPEVIGADYEGWPGEKWLDISNLDALAPMIEARLDLCAAKGFDGVDPDNLDGAQNASGFEISKAEQLAYVRWLAAAAHARGLAIGLKNVPEHAAELEPDFDWALVESCFLYDFCEDFLPFIEAGKPVFAIEYVDEGMGTADFCTQAGDLGFSALLKNIQLDEFIQNC